MKYGKSYYDFNEGSLIFTAPNQVMSPGPGLPIKEGWGLFFHPDLLNRTELGRKIKDYSFFHYDTNEALHVSDEEKSIIKDCVQNLKREYSQSIDKHTQGLIQSNIELLLNYCNRFYDRQFFSRAVVNNDLVQRFERYTGKTTQEYIHLQLTEKAKSLLWGSDKSISEIAYELGFQHPSHFTKIFKTKTGKSPTAFRGLNYALSLI